MQYAWISSARILCSYFITYAPALYLEAEQHSSIAYTISLSALLSGAIVYLERERQLADHVRNFLKSKYRVDLANIAIDAPPKVEMGEFAMPFSFELAKQLRKAPRKIAEEVVAAIPVPYGFEGFEVAGGGYINARLRRDIGARSLAAGDAPLVAQEGEGAADVRGKILVE